MEYKKAIIAMIEQIQSEELLKKLYYMMLSLVRK